VAERKAPPLEELERVLRDMEPLVDRRLDERLEWARSVLAGRKAERQPVPAATGSARQAVARRKRQIARIREELAEIVVTQPGVFLGRRGDRLLMRHEGEQISQIPLSAIRHITIPPAESATMNADSPPR
jgi:hypothetical protein